MGMHLALAATLGFAVCTFAVYLWKRSKPSTVPGLRPSSRRRGNLDDVVKAGGLHEFLMALHRELGPVASFWWGTEFTVSIASAELFRQHQHLSDKPRTLFLGLVPMVSLRCLQFANGQDARARRHAFDKVFTRDVLHIYYDNLHKLAEDVLCPWLEEGRDDHHPVRHQMFLFTTRAALVAVLGDRFSDRKEALALTDSYNVAWAITEARSQGPQDDATTEKFNEAMSTIRAIVQRALTEREEQGGKGRDFLLIDALIAHHADEDLRFEDALLYLIGGFHTSGNLLTWCVYYLSLHGEVQEKAHREIVSVIGPSDPVCPQSLERLTYLRQVIDESLRCPVVAPWGARVSDVDMELGGHRVPAGTPVIHAFGVLMQDEALWPQPDKFDPERFSPGRSKGRPTLAFSPFGFAGQRKCPAYQFAYLEVTILLVTLLQKAKVSLVPGQTVKQDHGFVTKPEEEIWVKVEKRGHCAGSGSQS